MTERDLGAGFTRLVNQIDPDRLYTTKEAANLLDCSQRTIQIMIQDGRLDGIYTVRSYRIYGEEIIEWLRDRNG